MRSPGGELVESGSGVSDDRGVVFWDFGIGTLRFLEGWADPTADIVIRLSFHRMTMEDVVLVIVFLWPLISGFIAACTQFPLWWARLAEKAQRRDRAVRYAETGQPTQYDHLEFREDISGFTEGELEGAPMPTVATERGVAGAGGRRMSSGTRPTRPTADSAPDAKRLPASSCFVSLWRWLKSLLPVQLRPTMIAARTRSWYSASKVTGPWQAIGAMCSSILFCGMCDEVCKFRQRRQRGRLNVDNEGQRGEQDSMKKRRQAPDLGRLALAA